MFSRTGSTTGLWANLLVIDYCQRCCQPTHLFLCSVLVLQAEYTELKEKAVVASKDRLYVSWRCNDTGMDCYNVGPGV